MDDEDKLGSPGCPDISHGFHSSHVAFEELVSRCSIFPGCQTPVHHLGEEPSSEHDDTTTVVSSLKRDFGGRSLFAVPLSTAVKGHN